MALNTSPQDNISPEVRNLLQSHREVIVIYIDPISDSKENAVSVFVKMLDKDRGGQLAPLLNSILINLETTYGEERSCLSGKTTANSQESHS